MAYKDILPALYTTLTHTGANYEWKPTKMDMDTQASTEYEYNKDFLYYNVVYLSNTGGQEIDGRGSFNTGIYINTLTVKIQTLVFISTDRTVTDDDDYEDIVVRGKVLHLSLIHI